MSDRRGLRVRHAGFPPKHEEQEPPRRIVTPAAASHARRQRASVTTDRQSQPVAWCARYDRRSRITESLQVVSIVSFVFLFMVGHTSFAYCSHLGEKFTNVGIGEYNVEDFIEAGENFINSVSIPSIPHGEQERREP